MGELGVAQAVGDPSFAEVLGIDVGAPHAPTPDGLVAAAAADETIARIARPGPVSTFDGRVLWSEYDPVAKAYFLTQRFGTTTARLPVRPRAVPFDVDVGRKLGSDTILTVRGMGYRLEA